MITEINWTVTNSNNSDYLDIDGDTRICSICVDEFSLQEQGLTRKEAESNARLISAAPNLLKAAIDTLKWLEINHRAKEPEFFGELKAAIKKATA